MNPIIIPPPVWTWDGSEWSADIGPAIRIVARLDTRSPQVWRWQVQTETEGKTVVYRSSFSTRHERTPEAAQAAAWKALGEWLGAV